MKKNKNVENEYVRQLPIGLQAKLQDSTMFIRACEKRMIVFENGKWISKFEYKSTLSYFCGRCFCKDRPVGKKLIRGKNDMPVSDLEKMFGVENLKVGLKYYRQNKISERCQMLDIELNE